MFETIRDFIRTLREEGDSRRPSANDPDIAAVALFFHVIGADGEVKPAERARLKDLVASDYGRSGNEMKLLLEQAEAADRESVDLYSFTSVLNRRLGEAEKVRFVELLWELAYADGERHELEEHIVWRIADLMGVSGRDRVLARQRVEARTATGSEGGDVDET